MKDRRSPTENRPPAAGPRPPTIPADLNMADWFLFDRLKEGRGERTAIVTDRETLTYREIADLARRYGNALRAAGVEPEQRVLIALSDGPDFVGALFGTLAIGAVVVMVNPDLPRDAVEYFLDYTRSKVAVVGAESAAVFREAAGIPSGSPARGAALPSGAPGRHLSSLLVVGEGEFQRAFASATADLATFPSHKDDAAIWLFSGGTTGRPKAVVQTHASFVNTTVLYAQGALAYAETDRTLSVPKLYFGYATGSNLLFPFSVGATSILFPERCTADVLFQKIRTHRPTILVNVPTMVNHLVNHPDAAEQDLSCLRLATSAGEALPAELHRRWTDAFGVDLLDGLGTAEMWHVFLTNFPGRARPGTLGEVVPGFEVRVRDDDGNDLPDGETGWLWVRGGSRAIAYWHEMEKTREAFRGEWYVSGDMIRREKDGAFVYCGRADDMLKVSGKWLAPKELEGCLLQHPSVAEVAVVGVPDANGLVKPRACVVLAEGARATGEELARDLKAFAQARLEPYKYAREVLVLPDLPRTHLGKVDRGKLRELPGPTAAPAR